MKNISIIFLTILFIAPSLLAQNNYCEQFTNYDKFNGYFCDECQNIATTNLNHFVASKLGFELDIPANFKVVDFYQDNKVLIFDSLAESNYRSLSLSILDNNLGRTLDAFFLEYINTFFDNFVLDENQFFNYGNFYAPNNEGRYLYRNYTQGDANIFEISIFYYKRPNVYMLRFMGLQNDYYDLLCTYLPMSYSFKID
jgi:hypothetical protein